MFRENRLRRLLSQGAIAFGGVLHIASTAIVELMGHAGYDFVLIDTEHGMYDIDEAGELIRAAHGAGTTPLVRVLRNDPGLVMKALDLGAHGVVVPHVMSKEDARKAVESARYPPIGRRGSCPYVVAAEYSLSNWRDYQGWSNRETMLFVLVEDQEGAQHIEEILSVDGIDAVFIGPFDMSVGMGLKGDTSHPAVRESLDRVLSASRSRSLPIMHALLEPSDIKPWVDKGVTMFAHASDTALLATASAGFLKSVEAFRRPGRIGSRDRTSPSGTE